MSPPGALKLRIGIVRPHLELCAAAAQPHLHADGRCNHRDGIRLHMIDSLHRNSAAAPAQQHAMMPGTH